jgi:hypothetical protein
MPLHLPNLDDRAYADLVQEARGIIPTHAPDWTNHNPSDPGITLIELFASLTEMMLYRLNRVTDQNQIAFLRLLKGDPAWEPAAGRSLTLDIRDTVSAFRQVNRAVNREDFETLALAAAPEVVRATCVPLRNLEYEDLVQRQADRPGQVSVVIVPAGAGEAPVPDLALLEAVIDYLEPRRLLTTRVHVVGPRYVPIGARITLVVKNDAVPEDVSAAGRAALETMLHPLRGGADGRGWPFGRTVYVSEIYELFEGVDGVDYVKKSLDATTGELLSELTVDAGGEFRLARNSAGELVAVSLYPDELVALELADDSITIEVPPQLRPGA